MSAPIAALTAQRLEKFAPKLIGFRIAANFRGASCAIVTATQVFLPARSFLHVDRKSALLQTARRSIARSLGSVIEPQG